MSRERHGFVCAVSPSDITSPQLHPARPMRSRRKRKSPPMRPRRAVTRRGHANGETKLPHDAWGAPTTPDQRTIAQSREVLHDRLGRLAMMNDDSPPTPRRASTGTGRRLPHRGKASGGGRQPTAQAAAWRRGAMRLATTTTESVTAKTWAGADLNRRHTDFQSVALPTELPTLLLRVYLGVPRANRQWDRLGFLTGPARTA